MGMFLRLLKTLLPVAKAAAAATPNKVDDAVIVLLEEVLASLPQDEQLAMAHIEGLRAKNTLMASAAKSGPAVA